LSTGSLQSLPTHILRRRSGSPGLGLRSFSEADSPMRGVGASLSSFLILLAGITRSAVEVGVAPPDIDCVRAEPDSWLPAEPPDSA